MNLDVYFATFLGVYLLLLMVLVQGLVASFAHRAQSSYTPGIVDETLGPESFVFRSHRTLMNSIENVPFMLGLVFLAVLAGFAPATLAIIVWVYCAARLAHMVTYYLVATRKNPSLRSYFFMIGLLAQIVLFALLGVHWL